MTKTAISPNGGSAMPALRFSVLAIGSSPSEFRRHTYRLVRYNVAVEIAQLYQSEKQLAIYCQTGQLVSRFPATPGSVSCVELS